MAEPDLSAIGTDAPVLAPQTEMATREEEAFALAKAKQDNEHALRIRQHELGMIGRFFGSRDNAITYIVAFLVLASFAVLAIGAAGAAPAVEFFKAVGLAGMGYLTGKSLEAKKD